MDASAVDLQEWTTATPETCPALAGVRLPDDAATQRHCAALHAHGCLTVRERRDGVELVAHAHVGRIRLGPLQVTIRPKLQGMPLWQLLRYTYGLQDVQRLTDASWASTVLPFHDVLIALLLDEVEALLARNLQRRYVRQAAALPLPRGRIDIRTLVHQGGVQDAALPCIYDDRLEDCRVNQAMLAGLWLAIACTEDRALRRLAHRLIRRLADQVSRVRLTSTFWQQVTRERSRLTAAYDPALTLIALLMRGHGLSWEEGTTAVETEGVLFGEHWTTPARAASARDGVHRADITALQRHRVTDTHHAVANTSPRAGSDLPVSRTISVCPGHAGARLRRIHDGLAGAGLDADGALDASHLARERWPGRADLGHLE